MKYPGTVVVKFYPFISLICHGFFIKKTESFLNYFFLALFEENAIIIIKVNTDGCAFFVIEISLKYI